MRYGWTVSSRNNASPHSNGNAKARVEPLADPFVWPRQTDRERGAKLCRILDFVECKRTGGNASERHLYTRDSYTRDSATPEMLR